MGKVPVGLKKTASMVILQHQETFLLLCRGKEPNKGMYVPVGGKLEPYEDPRSAAIREAYEESGIYLEDIDFIGLLVETAPSKYNWQSYIYRAHIDYLPPPDCDEGTLHWIGKDELLSVPTPPTDWMIYQYLLSGKPFVFNAIYNDQFELATMFDELTGTKVI